MRTYLASSLKCRLLDPSADMGYILHRGDEKDPGPDQFLNFDTWGFEVWQVQSRRPGNALASTPFSTAARTRGDIDEQSAYWYWKIPSPGMLTATLMN